MRFKEKLGLLLAAQAFSVAAQPMPVANQHPVNDRPLWPRMRAGSATAVAAT